MLTGVLGTGHRVIEEPPRGAAAFRSADMSLLRVPHVPGGPQCSLRAELVGQVGTHNRSRARARHPPHFPGHAVLLALAGPSGVAGSHLPNMRQERNMLTAAGGLLGAEKGPWCCWGLRPAPRKGLRPPTPSAGQGGARPLPPGSWAVGTGTWSPGLMPRQQASGQRRLQLSYFRADPQLKGKAK